MGITFDENDNSIHKKKLPSQDLPATKVWVIKRVSSYFTDPLLFIALIIQRRLWSSLIHSSSSLARKFSFIFFILLNKSLHFCTKFWYAHILNCILYRKLKINVLYYNETITRINIVFRFSELRRNNKHTYRVSLIFILLHKDIGINSFSIFWIAMYANLGTFTIIHYTKIHTHIFIRICTCF